MDFDSTIYTKSAKETQSIGKKLGNRIRKKVNGKRLPAGEAGQKGREEMRATAICLYGELGSGKTTFVQGFAKGLGIASRLLSPTFIIVRRYKIPKIDFWLYHIDLYRLVHEKELETLGIREIFQNPHNIIAIEWAEKFKRLMPEHRMDIKFSILQSGNHQINVTEVQ